jgi:colicin import membrane protein
MPTPTRRRRSFDDPELQRQLNDAMGVTGDEPTPTELTPAPPLTPIPDVGAARAELAEAKYDQWARSEGAGPEAGSRAAKFMEDFEPPPPLTAPESDGSWGDYLLTQPIEAVKTVGRALVPQVVRRDERPMSPDEVAEFERPTSYLEDALEVDPGQQVLERFDRPEGEASVKAIATAAAKGLTGQSFAEGMRGAGEAAINALEPYTGVGVHRKQPTYDEEGLPVENGTLYWLRLLGSTASSVGIETLGRMPVLPVADQNGDGWTTLSEALLGVESGHGQKVRFENPVADWVEGIGERLAEGRGLESDVQASFRERFGPEWANAGFYAGLPLDALTNWEGPFVKGASVVGTIANRMSAMKELAPMSSGLERLAQAVREPPIQTGQNVGEAVARALENGEVDIEGLPPSFRAALEITARQADARSLEEVARGAGVGIPNEPITTFPEGVVAANVRRTLAEETATSNQAGEAAAKAWRQSEIDRLRAETGQRQLEAVAETDRRTVELADELATDEQKFVADQQAAVAKLAADRKAAVEALVADEGTKQSKLAAAGEARMAELTAAREKEVGKLAEQPFVVEHTHGVEKLEAALRAEEQRAVDVTAKRMARAQELRVAAKAKADEPVAKLRDALAKDVAAVAAVEKKLLGKKLSKKARAELEAARDAAVAQVEKRQKAVDAAAPKAAPRIAAAETAYGEEVARAQAALKTARESSMTRAATRKKAMDAKFLKAQDAHKARVEAADKAFADKAAALQKRLEAAREKLAETAGTRRKKLDDDFVVERDEVIRSAKKKAAATRASLDRRKAELPAAVDAERAKQADRLAAIRKAQDKALAGVNETASPVELRQIRIVDSDTEFYDEFARALASRARKDATPPQLEVVGDAEVARGAPKRKFPWYKLGRADGFEVIKESSKQTPDQAKYVLWAEDGSPQGGGTLEEMATLMRKRRQGGDTIRWGDVREVADWDETVPGVPVLRRNYLFSSELEESVLKTLPPATGALRRLDVNPSTRVAGRFLFDLTNKAKAGYTPKTRLGELAIEAGRVWSRQKSGAAEHVMLPNMASVLKQDRETILREADAALGIARPRWDELMRGAKPTPEENLKLRTAASSLGIPYSGDVRPAFYRAARNAMMERVGGEIAKVRTGIKAVPRWHDKLLEKLGLITTDRERFTGVLGRIQGNTLAKYATGFFMEDRLAALAPADRARLVRLRTELERAGHEVVAQIRRVAQKGRGWFTRANNIAAELRDLLPGFAPVSTSDARLVDEVIAATAAHGDDRVDDLIEEVRARGQWQNWYDSPDPRVRHFGLVRWAEDQQQKMGEIAKDYLRLLVELTGRELRSAAEQTEIDKLTTPTLRKVYDEVFLGGQPLGPKTMGVLNSTLVGLDARGLSEEVVLAAYLVRLRQNAALKTHIDSLLDTGLAVRANDPRLMGWVEEKPNVLMAVALGNANHGGRVGYPSGAIAWAEHTLRRMGIEPGHRSQLVKFRLPTGDEIIIPRYLEGEIARAVSAGDIQPNTLGKTGKVGDSRSLADVSPTLSSKGANRAAKMLLADPLRWSKTWATTGYLWVVNGGYFLGTFLSVWPVQVTTRGVAATLRTAPSILAAIPTGIADIAVRGANDVLGTDVSMLGRQPNVVGELMVRVNAPEGAPIYAAVDHRQKLVWTAAGEAYHVDELAEIARAEGLSDTVASIEMSRALEDSLHLDAMGRLNPRRLLAQWNDTIRDLAGVVDQAARLGIFVDEVKRGTPPPEGAHIAKESVLNFRNLAPGEASVMRMIVMFYAYMRKEADVTLRALVEHPERLAQQARVQSAAFEAQHPSEHDRGRARKNDVGRVVLFRDEKDDNRDNRFQAQLSQSTPVGIAEQVNHAQLYAEVAATPITAFTTGDTADAQTLRELVAPWPWGLAMNLMGADARINDLRANRVPPFMMHGPVLDILNTYVVDWRAHFGIWPMPIAEVAPNDDVMLADWDASQQLNGEPSVWVIGAHPDFKPEEAKAARAQWQRWMLWLGRGFGADGTLQQQLRAVGFEENRPGVTDTEEFWSGLLGVRRAGVPTDHEAQLRALGDVEAEMQNAADEIPSQ